MGIEYEHFFSLSNLRQVINDIESNRVRGASRDRFTISNLRKMNDITLSKISNDFKLSKYKIRKYDIKSSAIKIESNQNLDNNRISFKVRMVSSPSNYDYPIFQCVKKYLNEIYIDRIGAQEDTKIEKILERIKINYKKIQKNKNQEWFMVGADFSSYFNNIEHDRLFDILKKQFKASDQVIKFVKDSIDNFKISLLSNQEEDKTNSDEYNKNIDGIYNEFKFTYDVNKGIPQGLPISSILAKMYMFGLEDYCIKIFGKKSVYIHNFVDDFFLFIKGDNEEKVKEKLGDFNFNGIRFNRNDKLEISRINSGDHVNFVGFDITTNSEGNLDISISKNALDKFINKIEFMFSRFEYDFKKTINLSTKEEDKFKSANIMKIIKFRSDINLLLTGHFDNKPIYKHYGWLGYYKHSTRNPITLKQLTLIDSMVDKFKRRSKYLNKIEFKKIVIAYTVINQKNDYFYVPKLDVIRNNRNMLLDYLYKGYFIKYDELEKMSQEKLISMLNKLTGRLDVDVKYFDIKRGKVLYEIR